MTSDEIAAINFDVPKWRLPRIPSVAFAPGIFGRCLYYYSPFYCTVFSSARPPKSWGSEADFPLDVLVLHHSPRSLTHSESYRNWRHWSSGEHKYGTRGGYYSRTWYPPRFFRETLRVSHIHLNVDVNLKRGDVLCMSGHTIQPLVVGENFDLVDDYEAPGVFGTENCPWFYAQSIDVYTAWPETLIDLADPTASLRALPSQTPRQIEMQPVPDSYRLAAA